jgi:hypothetical protein
MTEENKLIIDDNLITKNSEDSNEYKVILDDNLILYILTFIRTFPSSIPLEFLFDTKKNYIKKKELHNIYFNFCKCSKFYYQLFKNNSYIIFNKKYSKKYDKSNEFREEISKKIDITKLLVYSIKYYKDSSNFSGKKTYSDSLLNFEGEEKCIIEKHLKIEFLRSTYIEVLTFMKLENTEVKKISAGDLFRQINDFVKKEKYENNPHINIEGYPTRFRLIGDLRILFNFIKNQMILRGDLENPEEFPEHIAYTDIFKYIKYCFTQD